jgi:hypothetical protein
MSPSSLELVILNYIRPRTEKTIHDEEINNVDVGDMVADLKVSITVFGFFRELNIFPE